jgi:hypothetical protein
MALILIAIWCLSVGMILGSVILLILILWKE